MEAQLGDLVGWLITIALAVIGWFVYKLQAAQKTNNDLLRGEVQSVKDDAESDLDKAKASYKGMGERLDGQIQKLRDSVVFTDVFEQHEKLEEMREKNFRQMHEGLIDQLGAINRKIDTLLEAAIKKNGG